MKHSPRRASLVFVALAVLPSLPAATALGMDMKEMDRPAATTPGKRANEPVSGTGVIRSMDKAQGTVTLAHDPIKSINWPSMTMAFKVRDKASLDSVKPGARVNFTLERAGKDYVVTDM